MDKEHKKIRELLEEISKYPDDMNLQNKLHDLISKFTKRKGNHITKTQKIEDQIEKIKDEIEILETIIRS